MSLKWFLRDWQSPQRVVTGELTGAHISSPTAGPIPGDNDTNLEISPQGGDEIVRNRYGTFNDNYVLECEIHVDGAWRDQHLAWVQTMTGPVTVSGVWVDDDAHGSKTELHPLDVVWAQVTQSASSGDWIGSLVGDLGLTIGKDLFAYRFAAASDNRGDDLGGLLESPPLSEWTRTVTFSLPFPGQPGTKFAPFTDNRTPLSAHADFTPVIRRDTTGTFVDVTVTCQANQYGGPGIVLGEVIAYWQQADLPLISVSPNPLDFHTVALGGRGLETLKIANPGAVDLTVSVTPSGPPALFQWKAITAQSIAPGSSIALDVSYTPQLAEPDAGTLTVHSNAAPGAAVVQLKGTGTNRIRPP